MSMTHGYHMLEENMIGFVTSFGLGGILMGFINLFSGGSSVCLYLGLMLTTFGAGWWFYEMTMESTYNGDHSKMMMSGMKFGWMLWMFSEVLMFASMFFSFYFMTFEGNMSTGSCEPGFGLIMADWMSMPCWNTVLLTILGMSMLGWEKNLGGSLRKLSMMDFLWTFMMMFIFLMSQYYEFYNGLMSMSDGAFGSMYYAMIGLHGLHCFIGEMMMLWTGLSLLNYEYDEENHTNIWACGMNIHFLMAAWIFMFLLMYM